MYAIRSYYGVADFLSPLPGHEIGSADRGDTTRFEHDDLLFTETGDLQQRRRHPGRLAGAGRRLEDDNRVVAQGGDQSYNFV